MSDEIAMEGLPPDAPIMVAWRAYMNSQDYGTARLWLRGSRSPTEGDGELWSAFCRGWKAAQASVAVVETLEAEGS
jgi:hypothetical protein